jgi:hypothetical protein
MRFFDIFFAPGAKRAKLDPIICVFQTKSFATFAA